MLSKLRFIVPVAAIAAAIDLLTKAWAMGRLRTGLPIEVIEHFWHFRYVENTGMAWGMGKGMSMGIFIGLTSMAMAVLIYFIARVPSTFRITHTALAVILGGAIGNLVDRIRLGYVVDFIDWHWYHHHWPTFNVADAFISVGVVLLITQMLFSKVDPFAIREDAPDADKKAGKDA